MKAKIKKVKVYRLSTFQAVIKSTGLVLPIVSHETIKYEKEHGNFCADCPNYNAYVNECIPLNCQCKHGGMSILCKCEAVQNYD